MPSTGTLARLTALAALCVAIAYLAAVPLADLGNAPHADASPAAVAASLTEHRSGALVALALNAMAWCALMPLVFVGLRALAGPEAGISGTIVVVGAAIEAALIGVALILECAAALGAPRLSTGEVTALHDGYLAALAASAWPTIVCALAAAALIRRTGVLPRWTAGVALAVAGAHALAGVSVTDSGLFSATGPFATLAPVLMVLWLVAIGVTLLRTQARSTVVSGGAVTA